MELPSSTVVELGSSTKLVCFYLSSLSVIFHLDMNDTVKVIQFWCQVADKYTNRVFVFVHQLIKSSGCLIFSTVFPSDASFQKVFVSVNHPWEHFILYTDVRAEINSDVNPL